MSAASDRASSIQKALNDLSEVYQMLISNQTLHSELVESSLSSAQWREIDILFSSSSRTNETGQQDLFSLYQGIAAIRQLIGILVSHVPGILRAKVAKMRRERTASPNTITLLKLTVANIDSNAQLLTDRLADLYVAVNRADELQNGGMTTVGKKFPELNKPDTWIFEPSSVDKPL